MLSDRDLLATVQEAAEDFTVYGELGRHGETLAALLARQRADRRLVILMVQASTSDMGEVELSIEVKHELDARIPDGGTKCPACSATLRPWVRFCTRCGHDVTGKGASTPTERDELREAVKAAVEDEYEFLGEIRRSEGGGDVFFARERASGRIAALRLNNSRTDGEFELNETNILRKAPTAKPSTPPLVSVTQLLRKLEPESASSTPVQRAPNQARVEAASPVSAPSGLPLSPRMLAGIGVGVVAIITILTILVLR